MVKKTALALRRVPVGVKVIAILSYLAAALSIIVGVVFLSGDFFKEIFLDNGALSDTTSGDLQLIFVACFIDLGILGIFVGRGLWSGQRWARDVTLVLSGTSILFGIWEFFRGNRGTGTFDVLYGLIIGFYLLLNRKATAAFSIEQ